MGSLDGRSCIVTGAGRGLGQAHALFMAAEGARVVVNDVGSAPGGGGTDPSPAEEVVAEIRARGGTAVASHHDVADWDDGRRLVATAIEEFGDLHVLVNNAGILRDRAIVNMSEQDWDDVMRVHLKGHFVPTRWAATHWRQLTKEGRANDASVVNTSSTSGLLGNPGQSNYGAAKAGVAAFSSICAKELARYGVRVNCIAPAGRTRLTEATPGLADVVATPAGDEFDVWDPANVSPLVAWLASSDCEITGRCWYVMGGTIRAFEPWSMGPRLERDSRWTVEELAEVLPGLERGL